MAHLPDFAPDYSKKLAKDYGLTDFIDASETPPAFPGVYFCKVEGLVAPHQGFSRFDGKNWSYIYSSPTDAQGANCLSYLSKSTSITRFYKGLASNPQAPTVVSAKTSAKGSVVINLKPNKSK